MVTSAPSRIVVQPKQFYIGVHKNYTEVIRFDDGQLLQCFRSKGSDLKLLTPGRGVDILDRRRGRMYLSTYNRKKKISQVFWLKEMGFDVRQEEMKVRQQDKSQRVVRVIGTGAIVNGK
jgi:hypothetical protein